MPEELVTVGSYSTPYEANLVKGELEAFDVNAVLADAETVHMDWLYSNMLGGVKVQVRSEDLAAARRILAMESDATTDADIAPVCPECGSARTRFFIDRRGSFLSWLLVSIPIFPALSRRVCEDCGAKWKG